MLEGKRLYEFGPFRLDPVERRLLREGAGVPLSPKAFDILLLLVENSGHLLTKEELMRRIWPDAFVEEANLAQNISAIRRVLDGKGGGDQYIETVPKVGYRFSAPVRRFPSELAAAPAVPPRPGPIRAETTLKSRKQFNPRIGILSAAGAVLLAVLFFAWPRTFPGRGTDRLVPIRSVAVLPLENLTSDPEQEYFSDGMTDELITDLAKIRSLRVISRNSVMPYKHKHKPVSEIGHELNVDAIVEGTVTRSGDHVRITAQLIDAPRDRHLWAETYDRDLRDILALQDEVAKAIASEIKVTLTPPEQTSLSNARPADPAANEAYLRGLYELHGMTAEPTEALRSKSIEKAIGYFQEALSHDASDAQAYSGLADAYYSLSTFYRAPLQVMPKAKAAAAKAVELDDTLAEAHASLGYVSIHFDWDWARGEREFRRALELNPSSSRAHSGYAQYLLFVRGRSDQAIQELRQAYALDPLLPQAHGDLAWFLFLARRYSESIEAALKVGRDDHILALSYAELGQYEQALAAADRAIKTAQSPAILSQIAAAYALAGRKDKAREMIPGIEGQAQKRYVCGFNVACLYSALGEKEQAFAWLDKAFLARSD